jgi:hypothetical protein
MEIKTPTYESKDVTNYEEFPKDNLCFWDDEKRVGYLLYSNVIKDALRC